MHIPGTSLADTCNCQILSTDVQVTFVRTTISPLSSSCTLMIRCTMGMSRSLRLNTTTSPALSGFLPMCRSKMSPRQ